MADMLGLPTVFEPACKSCEEWFCDWKTLLDHEQVCERRTTTERE